MFVCVFLRVCVYVDFSGQAWVLQALCYSKFLRFHRCFRPGLLLQTLFLITAWPLLGLFDRCFRLGLVSTNPKAPREPREARRVRREQASPIAKVLPTIRANKTHFPFDCQGRFSENGDFAREVLTFWPLQGSYFRRRFWDVF